MHASSATGIADGIEVVPFAPALPPLDTMSPPNAAATATAIHIAAIARDVQTGVNSAQVRSVDG